MEEVRASLGRVRISARKARLVCDAVRGQRVVDAQAMLRFMPQKTAFEMERLMKSLVANAENNKDLDPEHLWIKEVFANEGITYKRFQPKARGRVGRINKRTDGMIVRRRPKKGTRR
jgi:large subunit ribosomal protein L22